MAVGVAVLGREEFRDVLRHIGREPAVALPGDEVRGVRGVDDVGGVDLAAVFLRQALELPLRAGALDPHRDARILRLEAVGDALATPAGPSPRTRRRLPSFLAASISAGVTASAAGACARIGGAANTPCSSDRRRSP